LTEGRRRAAGGKAAAGDVVAVICGAVCCEEGGKDKKGMGMKGAGRALLFCFCASGQGEEGSSGGRKGEHVKRAYS